MGVIVVVEVDGDGDGDGDVAVNGVVGLPRFVCAHGQVHVAVAVNPHVSVNVNVHVNDLTDEHCG